MKELRERLTKEAEGTFKGRREEAVKKAVLEQLLSFCEQDAEFLQAVKDSGKGLEECCRAIMKDVGSFISDIEVYRRMAAFFFPGAGVNVQMTINLSAEAEAMGDVKRIPGRAVVLDLFSELL